jgi:hypothetical protein
MRSKVAEPAMRPMRADRMPPAFLTFSVAALMVALGAIAGAMLSSDYRVEAPPQSYFVGP